MKKSIQISLASILALTISGCSLSQPGTPSKPKIDPTLPTVTGIKSIRDINSIAFEWKPIQNDVRVDGYYIYRKDQGNSNNKLVRVASVKDRHTSHYVDTKLKPATKYYYGFSTYTAEGVESESSITHMTQTLPVIKSVTYFVSLSNLPRKAKLLWRPHQNPRVKSYIVERNSVTNYEWKEVGKVENRLQAEFIDNDLKDNTIYRYRLKAVTYDGIVSTPSDIVEVATKPIPVPVQNIHASTELPKKIEITWSPNPEKDIAYYIIYQGSSSDGSFSELKKVNGNKYVDVIDADGKTKFYKVAAVDKDGLTSVTDNQIVAGNTLVKPMVPTIEEAKIEKETNSVIIRWSANDERVVSYNVVKTTKEDWINKKTQKITNFKKAEFIDEAIAPDVRYTYQIIGVDEFGIESEPTDAVELFYKSQKKK